MSLFRLGRSSSPQRKSPGIRLASEDVLEIEAFARCEVGCRKRPLFVPCEIQKIRRPEPPLGAIAIESDRKADDSIDRGGFNSWRNQQADLGAGEVVLRSRSDFERSGTFRRSGEDREKQQGKQ
jgi:hypothetical protein